MQLKKITFFIFTAFLAVGAYAQDKISGVITDSETGEFLVGATIIGKGTTSGTKSNEKGEFTLNVKSNVKTVIVSYLGYVLQEVDKSNTSSIKMKRGSSLNAVNVIGSRKQSRTKVETAVPVDIIPVSQIVNEVGQVDLQQILTFAVPSFQSSKQTIADGTDHIDPANLRGLGTDQVLVLVNGKRRHQSSLVNVNGTVNRGQTVTDLSTIPADAIERIEILRDGAAAQYGSDAIAGVINIVLKKSGKLSTNVSYGVNNTDYAKDYAYRKLNNISNPDEKRNITDGRTVKLGINATLPITKKGFSNFTFEYKNQDFTSRAGTYTGTIYPSSVGTDAAILAQRGLTRDFFDMRIGNSQMRSFAGFANAGFDINDNWSIVAFGGASRKEGEAGGFFRYPTLVESRAGIYKTQALALYPNGFLPLIQTGMTDVSGTLGVNGKIFKDVKLSLSNTYGQNNIDYNVANSINFTQYAVTSTPQTSFDAGGTIFRQNTTNLDLNKEVNFLEGLSVALGAEYRWEEYQQRVGEESSYKNYNTASGAVSGAQVFSGFTPSASGIDDRKVWASYLDVELDITKKWLLSGALRFEDYSDFGNTLNWKLASRYKLSDWLIIRGSASTGFRAPGLQQKFYSKTSTAFISQGGQQVPVESGIFTNESAAAKALGIPNLKQEVSKNYALGLTLNPAKNLEITLDGYRILIDDRIILSNNFTAASGTPLYNSLVAAGATTASVFSNAINTNHWGFEGVINYKYNLGEHQLRPFFAVTYQKNEVEKNDSGQVILNSTDILRNSGNEKNYFNREDQSRIEVANPIWKFVGALNYKYKKINAMIRMTHFGEVQYLDPNMTDPSKYILNAFTGQKETLDQVFTPKTVFDMSLGLEMRKGLIFTLGMNNVFDIYPDMHTHSGNISSNGFLYSRRVQQMGANGRHIFGRISWTIK